MVKLLLRYVAVPQDELEHGYLPSLHLACSHSRVKFSLENTVRVSLSYGVDPNTAIYINDNRIRKSVLQCAVAVSHIAIFNMIVRAGAAVNTSKCRLEAAVHSIVQHVSGASESCKQMLSTLVQEGADVSVQNSSRDTPLHIAARRDLFGFMQIMLEARLEP